MSSPRDTLEKGAEILAEFLTPRGFRFEFTTEGVGSGGAFAAGVFRREDRTLELHFRYSLGLVSYSAGDYTASHNAYMTQLNAADCSYPAVSDDPLRAFRGLRSDLERFAEDFLAGDASVLRAACLLEREQQRRDGQDSMTRSVGDLSRRQQARELFRQKRYAEVRQIYDQLVYPDRLSLAEQKLFEMAKRRCHDV